MKILLKRWDVLRLLRLVAGAAILYSAFAHNQPLLGILGGILLAQAALNMGCGPAGCNVPSSANRATQLPLQVDKAPYEQLQEQEATAIR